MSSCTKDDLESPTQMPEPQAIEKSDQLQIDGVYQLTPVENGATPVFINDDGDNEEEGTNVGGAGIKVEPNGD